MALSKLTQEELDEAIQGLARSGKPADLRALAALADQAFGKPMPAEDAAEDDALERMSREDRAELQATLEKLEAADVVALSVPAQEGEAPQDQGH